MSSERPVLDQTLPNGLRLLLREDHSAPIASFWTWYRVGSRDESPGLTGVSLALPNVRLTDVAAPLGKDHAG